MDLGCWNQGLRAPWALTPLGGLGSGVPVRTQRLQVASPSRREAGRPGLRPEPRGSQAHSPSAALPPWDCPSPRAKGGFSLLISSKPRRAEGTRREGQPERGAEKARGPQHGVAVPHASSRWRGTLPAAAVRLVLVPHGVRGPVSGAPGVQGTRSAHGQFCTISETPGCVVTSGRCVSLDTFRTLFCLP